jgi:hypothetical protein
MELVKTESEVSAKVLIIQDQYSKEDMLILMKNVEDF